MNTTKQKVFIVHGHDTDKRNQVELFLRRIGLDPIILCNEPSKGKTIIDKFEAYSDVSFAIVAKHNKYTKPQITQDYILNITEAYSVYSVYSLQYIIYATLVLRK